MINEKYNKETNQNVFKGINQNKVIEITTLKLPKICLAPGTFISLMWAEDIHASWYSKCLSNYMKYAFYFSFY